MDSEKPEVHWPHSGGRPPMAGYTSMRDLNRGDMHQWERTEITRSASEAARLFTCWATLPDSGSSILDAANGENTLILSLRGARVIIEYRGWVMI
jgi:hypothetical protein